VAVRAGFIFLLALSACSYLLPASWRAFRADPDDAAPAITRALDSSGVQVETLDQRKREIVTRWASTSSGVLRTRERYLITWERDPKEQSLTIYVRHEEQEQEIGEAGATKWGATSHDDEREGKILDAIEAELKR
jgi:hypothetical protein